MKKLLLVIAMVLIAVSLFATDLVMEPKAGKGTVEMMALPSTVAIISEVGFGAGGIATEDGYIVTAKHVVSGSQYVEVYFNDFTNTVGRVVGYHSIDDMDIAVIKVDTLVALPCFSTPRFEGDPGSWDFVLNPTQINVGEEVYVIGHPIGLTWSMTKGILSAKRLWGDDGLKYLQIDAATNQGNSGGPVVNGNGQIVGIIVFGVPAWAAEGLHFGISVESFGEEVVMLIEKDRERLGIITDVREDEVEEPTEKPRQIIITLPDDIEEE